MTTKKGGIQKYGQNESRKMFIQFTNNKNNNNNNNKIKWNPEHFYRK